MLCTRRGMVQMHACPRPLSQTHTHGHMAPRSNKRWCCGDKYHFDMSSWTFEKLADKKWGVIALKFRELRVVYVTA